MAAGMNPSAGRWWVIGIRLALVGFVATSGAIAFASWWLTAPLADRLVPTMSGTLARTDQARSPGRTRPVWPRERLEGEPAKLLLLDIVLDVAERLDAIDGYTATFHKQERIDGTLGPVQTLAMKTRHHPFAIYLKFLAPSSGKELVYAEGHHDNKVIAHSGGVARLLVPRLALEPTHPLVLAGSRHAVTEAGLANLTAKLVHYRQLDMKDPEAVTILDRFEDASGKSWLRSIHTHDTQSEARPFARVEGPSTDPRHLLPSRYPELRLAQTRPERRAPPGRALLVREPRCHHHAEGDRLRPGEPGIRLSSIGCAVFASVVDRDAMVEKIDSARPEMVNQKPRCMLLHYGGSETPSESSKDAPASRASRGGGHSLAPCSALWSALRMRWQRSGISNAQVIIIW